MNYKLHVQFEFPTSLVLAKCYEWQMAQIVPAYVLLTRRFVGIGITTTVLPRRLFHRGVQLGKVLRLDVDGQTDDLPYGIPEDNPFVNEEGARKEVYAYGFRSIFRCDVDHGDPETGKYYTVYVVHRSRRRSFCFPLYHAFRCHI